MKTPEIRKETRELQYEDCCFFLKGLITICARSSSREECVTSLMITLVRHEKPISLHIWGQRLAPTTGARRNSATE